MCETGSYAPLAGLARCQQCARGSFQDELNTTKCKSCDAGDFCPAGASLRLAPPCKQGTYANQTDLGGEPECFDCQPGFECAGGGRGPAPCSPGSFSSATRSDACKACPAGTRQPDTNATACTSCDLGYFCPPRTSAPIPCPEGRFGNRTDLGSAETCETCSAGTYCPVGSARATSCETGTHNPWPGQPRCRACDKGRYQHDIAASVCSACAPGHWCSADTQIACSENTYNPSPLGNLVTNCTRCPERTSTLGQSGAVSIEACFCDRSFYLAPETRDTSNDPACKDRCCVCPIGTDCSAGAIKLARLPIKPGYFRVSADAIDVRRCPDAAAGCSGVTCDETNSGCSGGNRPDEPCRVGLRGAFCRQCNDSGVFYVPAEKKEAAHCAPCEGAVSGLASMIMITLFGCGLAIFACVAVRLYGGKQLRHYQKRARAVAREYTMLNKLKILIGFFQIVIKVDRVYQVRLPAEVRRLLQHLEFAISFGVEGVPLGCIGAEGYVRRLLLWMLLPAIVIVAASLSSVIRLYVEQRFTPRAAIKMITPVALYVSFLSYPIVTNIAFEAFSCYDFEGGRSWLIADVAIECNTGSHDLAQALAWTAVAMYPMGLILLNAWLLYSAREAIRSERPTSLSRALRFLHGDLKPHLFWWELMEMGRRFILIGLFVVWPFHQGQVMQLALASLVAMAYLLMQSQAAPYRNQFDNSLALSCSFSLSTLLLCCIFYKILSLTELEAMQARMSIEQRDDFSIGAAMLTFVFVLCTFGALAFTAVVLTIQLEQDRRHRLHGFRWTLDGHAVVPPLLDDGEFHTFLSHNWATGQDQARTIKILLVSLCPGLLVWLDVDDMRSKAGTSATDKASFEALIDGVQVMIAILTGSVQNGVEYSDYFYSVPCQHELERALSNGTPVVFVLETDSNHGGISLEAHRRACPDHLLPLLDGSKVVEWHRVQAYQDVSLKVILQELLHELAVERASHVRVATADQRVPVDTVYLRREIVREPIRLPRAVEGSFHLYVSNNNLGADKFFHLLEDYLNLAYASSGDMKRIPLMVTNDSAEMRNADHFLCYLNAHTHTSSETTLAFHAELEVALQTGHHIILVHETRAEAHGAPFKVIIDATPTVLKFDDENRVKRLYRELAIMICGNEASSPDHLNVGLHLLLNAIAESPTPMGGPLDARREVAKRRGSRSVARRSSERSERRTPASAIFSSAGSPQTPQHRLHSEVADSRGTGRVGDSGSDGSNVAELGAAQVSLADAHITLDLLSEGGSVLNEETRRHEWRQQQMLGNVSYRCELRQEARSSKHPVRERAPSMRVRPSARDGVASVPASATFHDLETADEMNEQASTWPDLVSVSFSGF